MVLIFHSFKDACFSDLDLDMQVFQIWKTSGLEDFLEVSGSLLTESSPMSPFHNRSERFGKFLCLIFLHLVTSCCIKLPFQTTSTKSSRRLPGSLLTGSSSISSGV
uniref:Uncharacterized protein n=1 Tax=Brassica oleracea TaxID=3712 RepID=A0A3P6EBS8_BRAOL|nr:unnamed protein product [Brassica oleracea]